MNSQHINKKSGLTGFAQFAWLLWSVSILLILQAIVAVKTSADVVETKLFRFEVNPETGAYKATDKQSGVVWESNPEQERFGVATVKTGDKTVTIHLSKCDISPQDQGRELIFRPAELPAGAQITIRVKPLIDGRTLEFSYSGKDVQVERINLLDSGFWVSDADNGYLVVPVREGMLIPANSGKAYTHSFGTFSYEGCHMEMFGAIKRGSAILVSWHDPYVTLNVTSKLTDKAGSKRQQLLPSLALSKTANYFRVHFLGKGDYVTIGKAYREIAKEKGWFVSWNEKLKGEPKRELLFGAANIKLWSLLSRRMSEDSTRELSKSVNWTFDEAAQVAEHIKNDLKIERVLFTIGGWIHRGYDNQHPDILPAAPECGGNDGLADCARRVMKLGYLFCMHDNYQDIYRDSPSWNEDYIMKNPDGKLVAGGHWAGGRAYLTCSKMALELAQRPQNLPEVKKITGANSYFIDTTYAAGLYECFDPKHPLTRWDDMKWKQALSDYARSLFGVFGSECGREWAIPCADFFEGLTGVSGRYYHDAGLLDKLGGIVIPLFEIVYRDCIQMYGKYGYDINNCAEYVLAHIIFGRPLNYHSIPRGLYWKTEPKDSLLKITPSIAYVKQTAPGRFEIAYDWDVSEPPTADYSIFVHFTDKSGKILFQNDHRPEQPTSKWKQGINKTGPFTVSIPEGLKPPFDIRVGMFQPPEGGRVAMRGKSDGEARYIIGYIKGDREKLEFESVMPVQTTASADRAIFVRANNGWADGLHPMDRFIKNTCEVLLPLNEITSRAQLNNHAFLSPDYKIQRSIFGSGKEIVQTVVNASDRNYTVKSELGGTITLPTYGFLIESVQFVAFLSMNWNGVNYNEPTMFTLRSLDGRELSRSRKIRVFHSFGDSVIVINKKRFSVHKEEIIQF